MLMKKMNDKTISDAMKKYLIGKELRSRIEKAEEAYIKALHNEDEEYLKNHKLNSKGAIAKKLGEECHLSATTVINYGNYSDVLEQVKEKNELLVKQILAGETHMTYKDLKKMIEVL